MTGDIFDGLFDFDLDGKTDSFELALGFNMILEDEERSERAMRSGRLGSEDDEDDMLAMAGLNRLDLELMDEEEQREALEDAGIDPDDFI